MGKQPDEFTVPVKLTDAEREAYKQSGKNSWNEYIKDLIQQSAVDRSLAELDRAVLNRTRHIMADKIEAARKATERAILAAKVHFEEQDAQIRKKAALIGKNAQEEFRQAQTAAEMEAVRKRFEKILNDFKYEGADMDLRKYGVN